MADQYKTKEILLNGKLVTSRDAATIGENNFQEMTNLRYTDTNPKGIKGMTKINLSLPAGEQLDFTDFTEVDVVADRVSVASDTITVTDIDNDEEAYVYDDYGAGYFAGDFTFFFTINVGTTATADNHASGYCFGMANNVGDLYSLSTQSRISVLIYQLKTTQTYTIFLGADTAAGGQQKMLSGFSNGTTYYCKVFRNESVGTYGSLTLGVYSDSDMTTEVDADTITLTEKADFRYLYAMSSYNSAATGQSEDFVISDFKIDCPKIRSGYHFRKQSPAAESHVLVQTFNEAETQGYIFDNATAIPDQGSFTSTEIFTDVGAGSAYFSSAPNGYVCMCNQLGAHVWGGNESNVGAFITSTAAVTDSITNPRDYTHEVKNSLQTTAESAVIGGGNDSSTVLLAHFDGTDADMDDYTSEDTNTHTMTQEGTAQLDTDQSKFGASSALFDGNSDYYTVDDSDGVDDWWHMDTNEFTVDFWARFNTVPATDVMGIFQQYVDDDNWVSLYYYGTSKSLIFRIRSGAAEILQVSDLNSFTPVAGVWYHIALIRGWGGGADSWAITVNGVATATNVTGTASGAWPDLNAVLEIGRGTYLADTYFNGWIDEFRFSTIARWTAAFTPPARPYSTSARTFLIGSILPIKGAKFYVSNPNTVASTTTMKYWNGNSWTSHTLTADGTKPSTISLAQTGSMTWASTIDSSKVKYLNGSVLYWYQFSLSAGDADVYKVTVDASMQHIQDLWNGIERECLAFWHNDNGKNLDYSHNIFDDSYDSNNTATFCSLDSLVKADDYLLAGFSERMMGINIGLITSNNGILDIGLTVNYWNGSAWTSVSGLVDETEVTDGTFSQSGVISWTPPNREEEFETDVQNGIPLYYYKFEFDTTNFGNSVELYHVSGIPAQKHFHGYGYPIHAGGALWLLSQTEGQKNQVLKSAPGTVSFWNGDESLEFEIGDDAELTAGSAVYIQLGSNLYEVVLICKRHETWMVLPGADGTIQKFRISDKVGCVAPGTMKAAHLGSLEIGSGRSIVMWQGGDGIYMFDGKAPVKVSEDIDDLFDKSNSSGLDTDYIDDSTAEFDIENWEYHWFCRTGATATWDEWVFDLKRGKWYQVDRGSTKALKCGISVMDTIGNFYMYGGTDTGYLERLENGTDFDGNDIVHTLKTSDFVLNDGKVSRVATIRDIKLVGVAKNTTSNTISTSYFKDTNTSADESFSLSPAASGKRIFQDNHGMGREGPAVFHCFNFSMTTDDETIGFEPMFMSLLYKDIGTTKGR